MSIAPKKRRKKESPQQANVEIQMEPSYLLHSLEVFNWGPFSGMHKAEFDPAGTAIIGPTGSGKTTLVDALMTLLVSQPRYNLASTGGHESDRTLISYVRGVLGGDGSDGREEISRTGKTITGICATYFNGEESVRLAALLWTDGNGNGAEDLKRRWIFSTASDQTLEHWLAMLHEEGIRDLLKMGRETPNIRMFDSKKAYLAHIRKFFDVGENAFTLLNRAAGLKQLNSIDEIFRELVLDDRSAFDRAIEVAGEFDNLAAIHEELEVARRQLESLIPIQEEFVRLGKAQRRAVLFDTLKRILPVWFALLGEKKWEAEAIRLLGEIESLEETLAGEKRDEADLMAEVDLLRSKYLEVGGNVIGELEKTIGLQRERVEDRRKNVASYQRLLARFGLPDDLSESTLLKNQSSLAQTKSERTLRRDEQQTSTFSALAKLNQLQSRRSEVEETLKRVEQRPGSNIPIRYQDFRYELARELGVKESDLPFLAELLEVKTSEAAWRGAIERAIGSERLRVLVPRSLIKDALDWVNGRDNRLHVRLYESVSAKHEPSFFEDGYVGKLNFKPHPLLPAAKQLLSGRDLHCVSSTAALHKTEHAITVEGLISGKKGKFEKQDNRRLDQDWMTGFDNKDQLDALVEERDSIQLELEKTRIEADLQKQQLRMLEDELQSIDLLMSIEFSTIDLPTDEFELSQSERRLAGLLAPDSDATLAKKRFDKTNENLKILQNRILGRHQSIAKWKADWENAKKACQEAVEGIGDGLTEDEKALGDEKFDVIGDVPASRLFSEERRVNKVISEGMTKHYDFLATVKQHLVRKMEVAKRLDTGALAEVGSDIDDVQHYLDRLRVLNEESLPEKQGRFLDYLNRSSDQGVTQLLSNIDEEVGAIEERILELNQTLVKVDFRSGRYLQLMPQRTSEERLRSLDVAQRKVRSAALKDDGGESHFKALQEMVAILRQAGENRRLLGSKALLDPRFRLQFFVVEVDRQTGDRSPPRTGSQSGSGGEKELMASHILTASLSYALCPPAATRPLYGTVILDEAFSKSSPSAASRIIEALRIFCLHPIFVTPNKEIGLLKQHTRKVICVQRPAKQASLASITWEKLETMVKGK